MKIRILAVTFSCLGAFALAGCATNSGSGSALAETSDSQSDQDRLSILSMTGDYKVTFDFTETVAFVDGYELKEPKLSGGYESVRVVEDRGDFISLQHILVVGPDEAPIVVKHWRQDWQYEPEEVLVFIGGNAWKSRAVSKTDRRGAWSQTVYQVEDAPRYGAVGRWTYEDGIAEWTPPNEWRPLPRRDMTTRDDYNAVDAVNRHVITPFGWVHEQDNSKLVLTGQPQALVREVGVNTYQKFSDYPVSVADEYWAATSDYWEGVRAEWAKIVAENEVFAITIQGETEDLYNPLLKLAKSVQDGKIESDAAIEEARGIISKYVTPDIGNLADRLRPTTHIVASDY